MMIPKTIFQGSYCIMSDESSDQSSRLVKSVSLAGRYMALRWSEIPMRPQHSLCGRVFRVLVWVCGNTCWNFISEKNVSEWCMADCWFEITMKLQYSRSCRVFKSASSRLRWHVSEFCGWFRLIKSVSLGGLSDDQNLSWNCSERLIILNQFC